MKASPLRAQARRVAPARFAKTPNNREASLRYSSKEKIALVFGEYRGFLIDIIYKI